MLEVKNLFAGYPGGFMLADVSFAVRKGDFAGIIGPNGSGKTTLLKTLARALKPERGDILLDSASVSGMGFREAARKTAVVSQFTEAGYMTVEDYVLLGRMPYYKRFQLFESASDRKIAGKYMELTGITRIKDKFMGEISGGETQLASIARALTQEPELLLLDEPTAHLDIKHQLAVLDLLKRMNSGYGITVVSVLHDLNLAGQYCSVLMLMDGGRLHSAGPPGEVMTYAAIEEVYDTVVIVMENPVSGKPFVVPVPGEEREKARESKSNPA